MKLSSLTAGGMIALATATHATITLLPPTPYLRFTDSPFHAAAAAGDALKFTDNACNDPAGWYLEVDDGSSGRHV